MGDNFCGSYVEIKKPIRDSFKLHTHEEYEIYAFFEGDVEYIVEGTTYSLSSGDVMVMRPGEMHRAYHKSDKRYGRMVFNVAHEFFEENGCKEYLAVFNNRAVGTKNKIAAEFVQNSGLLDALKRWYKYTNNGQNSNNAVARSVLIEILHILNNIDVLYDDEEGDNLIKRVIFYINQNFNNKITLEELEREFFVSKYHLCRVFKKATGYTIVNYINRKRITQTKELYKKGMNISEACIEAGFSNYSSFYKTYLKEFGVVPKEGLTN